MLKMLEGLLSSNPSLFPTRHHRITCCTAGFLCLLPAQREVSRGNNMEKPKLGSLSSPHGPEKW